MFRKRKYQNLSDNELLSEYSKSFNKKIIAEIYNRYYHLILGVCLKFNNNKTNCKDVVSWVFEKLIYTLSYKQINSLSPWLYTVTRNKCFAENKNKIILKQVENVNLYNDDNFVEKHKNISDDIVKEAIKKLKPEQRECIELFYLQNKSYNQICEITNYSCKKVKSHLQNGKRNLKIIIEKLNK